MSHRIGMPNGESYVVTDGLVQSKGYQNIADWIAHGSPLDSNRQIPNKIVEKEEVKKEEVKVEIKKEAKEVKQQVKQPEAPKVSKPKSKAKTKPKGKSGR